MRKFAVFCIILLSGTATFSNAASDFKFGITGYHIPFDSYRLGEKDFERIAGNGMGWLSVDFAWKDIEKEEGKYNFSYYDFILENAERTGLHVLAKVGNGYNGVRSCVPEWTVELSNEEYLIHLADYARAVAERYGEKIEYYAIENEPNSFRMHLINRWRVGDWSEERLTAILKAIENSIRSVDKDAEIVLSVAVAPGWLDWIDRVNKEVSFDIVGIQVYKGAGFIADSIKKAKEYGKEVFVLETGMSTFNRCDGEQAEFINDAVTATFLSGGDGIFIYQYRDNPDEELGDEKHFGLIDENGNEKKSFFAYKEIIESISQPGNGRMKFDLTIKEKLSRFIFENRLVVLFFYFYADIWIKIFTISPPIRSLYLRLMDIPAFHSLINPLKS